MSTISDALNKVVEYATAAAQYVENALGGENHKEEAATGSPEDNSAGAYNAYHNLIVTTGPVRGLDGNILTFAGPPSALQTLPPTAVTDEEKAALAELKQNKVIVEKVKVPGEVLPKYVVTFFGAGVTVQQAKNAIVAPKPSDPVAAKTFDPVAHWPSVFPYVSESKLVTDGNYDVHSLTVGLVGGGDIKGFVTAPELGDKKTGALGRHDADWTFWQLSFYLPATRVVKEGIPAGYVAATQGAGSWTFKKVDGGIVGRYETFVTLDVNESKVRLAGSIINEASTTGIVKYVGALISRAKNPSWTKSDPLAVKLTLVEKK